MFYLKEFLSDISSHWTFSVATKCQGGARNSQAQAELPYTRSSDRLLSGEKAWWQPHADTSRSDFCETPFIAPRCPFCDVVRSGVRIPSVYCHAAVTSNHALKNTERRPKLHRGLIAVSNKSLFPVRKNHLLKLWIADTRLLQLLATSRALKHLIYHGKGAPWRRNSPNLL